VSKKISKEELIKNLKRLQKKLGRSPKKSDLILKNGSKYSINAYNRAFGSLYNSLMAANIKPNQARNISKQDIIRDLQNIYKQLGRTPTQVEYKKLSDIGYTCPTIKKYFKTWTKLLILANIPVEKARDVTKKDIIQSLNKWYDENKQETSCLEYWSIRKARAKRTFPFSCETISTKFNMSWENIMKQIDSAYETKDPYVNRKKSVGQDGNIYLSGFEKKIGDLLFSLKNNGKIDQYQYEKIVDKNRKWTCDFFIKCGSKELWVEADGLGNSRKVPYSSCDNEKIKYYNDNNVNYIILDYNSKFKKEIGKFIDG